MLSMDFVTKNLAEIKQCEILLVEGYFVIEKYEIVKFLVDEFNKAGKKVAFTLSATFMIDNFYDKMLEISNKSDIIFCNEDEAYAFAKYKSDLIDNVAMEIHRLLEPRERLVVITCGALPVNSSTFDYEKRMLSSTNTSVSAVEKDSIVDTNGCGDGN
jgi:adenosine kinase